VWRASVRQSVRPSVSPIGQQQEWRVASVSPSVCPSFCQSHWSTAGMACGVFAAVQHTRRDINRSGAPVLSAAAWCLAANAVIVMLTAEGQG